MSSPDPPSTRGRAGAYWKKNLRLVGVLLVVWFAVSLGAGVLFVDQLDKITVPGTGFKLGFWFAQQGSIYTFVVLIAVYVKVMAGVDREFGGKEKEKTED